MKLFQIDAFTDKPFSGNPAGVCLLDKGLDREMMQNIASEMNIAETAFLVQTEPGRFNLRWFTPAVEIDLCGHATLASAHYLYESGKLSPDQPISFDTKSGELRARKVGDKIELDFPAVFVNPIQFPDDVYTALGASVKYTGKNGLFVLFEVDSEKTVRALHPDLRVLVSLGAEDFIVTARSDSSKYDYVCRVFAPGVGIDEDPVTGSAHCALAPYWSRILKKEKLNAYQASKRGGEMEVELAGNRVLMRGHSVTIMEIDLKV